MCSDIVFKILCMNLMPGNKLLKNGTKPVSELFQVTLTCEPSYANSGRQNRSSISKFNSQCYITCIHIDMYSVVAA